MDKSEILFHFFWILIKRFSKKTNKIIFLWRHKNLAHFLRLIILTAPEVLIEAERMGIKISQRDEVKDGHQVYFFDSIEKH